MTAAVSVANTRLPAAPARRFDLAIIGAGILGLAHALAAARRGLSVIVIDRETHQIGASVRNFGFVTVTGQGWPDTWARAARAREIWAEVAPAAGIPVIHRGLTLVLREPEALPVRDAFLSTPMGKGCEGLDPAGVAEKLPMVRRDGLVGGLYSPHELRVEPRVAIAALTSWLGQTHGVSFLWRTLVKDIRLPEIDTTAGTVTASRVVVCPGNDFLTLYPEAIRAAGAPTLCKLHMLRTVPQPGGWRLPTAVMNELSCVRYKGYAALPEAKVLGAALQSRAAPELENGIHLIAVQNGDGSLTVGDSHHYMDSPDAFAPEDVDRLMLDQLCATLDVPAPVVAERWIGVYASAANDLLVATPQTDAKVVIVTSGTGMSTAFAIAEEVLADW